MNLLDFGAQVIVISASGVLAPGPLFFTNILYGTRHGVHSGLKVAYGHTAVELPLIVLLATGLFSATSAIQNTRIIGLIGGVAILGFASVQIIGAINKTKNTSTNSVPLENKSPFIAGITLSALNPYFLVWWFTVGLKLIADSATFGLALGISLLFAFHIWMDYTWLAITAYLASKGSFVLRSKYYPILLLILAVVLVYYGISSVFHAIV